MSKEADKVFNSHVHTSFSRDCTYTGEEMCRAAAIIQGKHDFAPFCAAIAQMAVSREREYLADASAVNITRYPEGMIDALKKLQSHSRPMKNQNSASASMYINDPLRKGFFNNLFGTHPPLEKRIERLENGKWSF